MRKILQKLISLLPLWLRKRVKDIPVLKQAQQALVEKYLDNSEFDAKISAGPAKGLNFPVSMPGDKLMYIGTWEVEFSEALSSSIRPGWVCFDIGGYKGYFSGIMALRGASKVYVFEPMPNNIRKIERLIQINPSLPIRLLKVAVSDTDENATFRIMPEATMGKLDKSSFQGAEEALQEIPVECVRLDSLIAQGKVPIPDFVKIDVEGAEAFVLEGGMEMLRKRKPLLMIEIHSLEIGKKVFAILQTVYSDIKVFETGLSPVGNTMEICHYIAR